MDFLAVCRKVRKMKGVCEYMFFDQNSNHIAKYLRISRDDGDKAESDSIGGQRNLIDDFIQNHDGAVSCREYVDDGYSGTNFERPSFQRMIEDAKKRKINYIIVKDACVIIEPTRKGPFERLSWLGSICF